MRLLRRLLDALFHRLLNLLQFNLLLRRCARRSSGRSRRRRHKDGPLESEAAPAHDSILEPDGDDVGDDPVEREAAGEAEGEDRHDERHHDVHHVVALLCLRVRGGHRDHLLDNVGREANEDRQHDNRRVRPREVHAKETAVQRHCAIAVGQPRVDLLRELHQAFRRVSQRGAKRRVEADPDKELEDEGAEAAQGIDPRLLPHLHLLFRLALRIVFVLLFELLHPGLHGHHGLLLLDLTLGQRVERHPRDERKGDDGEAEVRGEERIEKDQAVGHRPGDHVCPNDIPHQRKLSCGLWPDGEDVQILFEVAHKKATAIDDRRCEDRSFGRLRPA